MNPDRWYIQNGVVAPIKNRDGIARSLMEFNDLMESLRKAEQSPFGLRSTTNAKGRPPIFIPRKASKSPLGVVPQFLVRGSTGNRGL